jgi:hypothetical protein
MKRPRNHAMPSGGYFVSIPNTLLVQINSMRSARTMKVALWLLQHVWQKQSISISLEPKAAPLVLKPGEVFFLISDIVCDLGLRRDAVMLCIRQLSRTYNWDIAYQDHEGFRFISARIPTVMQEVERIRAEKKGTVALSDGSTKSPYKGRIQVA